MKIFTFTIFHLSIVNLNEVLSLLKVSVKKARRFSIDLTKARVVAIFTKTVKNMTCWKTSITVKTPPVT